MTRKVLIALLFTSLPAWGQVEQAARLFDAGDYGAALPLLERAQIQGDARASLLLCILYDQGLGVAADPARAFHLCHRAADQEIPHGQLLTAEKYALGRGTKQDLPRALHLYQRAADGGYLPAQLALGQIYAGALGPELQDPAQMMHYLQLAAAQGQPEGLFMLGSVQLAMASTDPHRHWDEREAGLRALTQAAQMNFGPAQYALGELYFEGKLVAGNAADALFWFTLADRAGFPEARARRYQLELGTNTGVRAAVSRRLSSWQAKPAPAP